MQLVQQPEQHKQLSHLNSDPAVLDQGHDSDVKDDLGGVDGLKRNNSSTALVDLVQVCRSWHVSNSSGSTIAACSCELNHWPAQQHAGKFENGLGDWCCVDVKRCYRVS